MHSLFWLRSKTLTPPSAGEDVEQQELSVGMQNCAVTLADSLAVSYALNILLPCNAAIMLLGIYPKQLKNYAHKKPAYGCL